MLWNSNRLGNYQFHVKKQGTNLDTPASSIRLINYIQKLGANQDEIESFLANLAHSPEPERLIDVADQIAQISMSESISLEELGNRVKQKEEEKQMLEEEIKQRRAILESANVDIITINEYKKLKEELNVHGLSLEDPRILLSILKTIREIGYEPQKIVREFSRIKSLRQTERELNNRCKALESRVAQYKEALPWCEEIGRLGIRNENLLTYHIAVCEKAEMHNISRESAAYRVIEDIQYYNKLGGMKKQLNNITMQICMMNQFSGRQNYALNALMKLQFYGITEDQILSLCKTIETNGEQSINSYSFSTF